MKVGKREERDRQGRAKGGVRATLTQFIDDGRKWTSSTNPKDDMRRRRTNDNVDNSSNDDSGTVRDEIQMRRQTHSGRSQSACETARIVQSQAELAREARTV